MATKFGNMRGPNGEFPGVNGKCLRGQFEKARCEKKIYLYYRHRVDVNTPIEETVQAKGGV